MRKVQLFTLILAVALATGCAERSWNPGASSSPQAPSTTVAQTSSTGVIPAGTQLVIRTNENIDARDASEANRDFDAEVAQDVVNENGTVLIPRGSRANLRVFQTQENELILGLRSVNVNGNEYLVQSADVARGEEGIGMNRRTATHVGGGALLGTLIGAAAGGAKGAAVGAAVGAGAGAAVQVFTKGREVKVPAETLLTFRLDDSIRLEGFR